MSLQVLSSKAKATMVRRKPTTTHTAGINISHSTRRFTVMLVAQTQHYIWTKLDTVWMAK